jgi:hypothetical protein
MIRRQEALLVLQKWRDERTPLRISAHLSEGIFNFDCRIVQFSEKSFVLQLANDADRCEFWIDGFECEYGEPRTADEAREELAGHTYRSVLGFVRSDNRHIAIMEISD